MKAKKTPSSTASHPLALHTLITALSFWGSSVRLFLVGFLAVLFGTARFIDAVANGAMAHIVFANEVYALVYIVGLYFVLDACYVIISRAYPVHKIIDQFVLLFAEAIIAILYFLPHIAEVSYSSTRFVIIAPMVVLFLLVLRALLGMLSTVDAKRK
jgi:hypothetical protein